MDNYKPRANFSVIYKFHNPLTKLGRTCTRRIDLTCAQHVNMKAHHSSAPFCNSTNRTNILYLLNYIYFILSSITCYSHVYKLFYKHRRIILAREESATFYSLRARLNVYLLPAEKEGEQRMSIGKKSSININIYF